MATPVARALVTAEELFERPDDGQRYELVAGGLVRMTPSGARHSAVAARIARLLDEHADAHDLGVCGAADPGFVLRRNPDSVRAPDVGFVARHRIPDTGVPTTYWPLAPDLAVEVISPTDRLSDVHVKIADYFAAGTRLVWIVEPSTRTVHVYRSPREVEMIGEDGELTGGDVLPEFRCAVRQIFPS
ncbi:MAG: Uma2 family endonuclease [Acidobacteria bacterium]|nr:Uma2 family endonuclease [Acidobacteriota bacterium]